MLAMVVENYYINKIKVNTNIEDDKMTNIRLTFFYVKKNKK